MQSQREAWQSGRPIHSRLPVNGYQDNQVAEALTDWIDTKLTSHAAVLSAWHRNADPDLCHEDYLDWLASLVGLAGAYWDTAWSPQIKRDLIKLSHPVLWKRKGTLDCIRRVLGTHQIQHQIWQESRLQMPFAMPGRFGTPTLRYCVQLPLKYRRSSQEWKEAARTVRNYSPAITKAQVCYEAFYLGFSKLGDPMFRPRPKPKAPKPYRPFRLGISKLGDPMFYPRREILTDEANNVLLDDNRALTR